MRDAPIHRATDYRKPKKLTLRMNSPRTTIAWISAFRCRPKGFICEPYGWSYSREANIFITNRRAYRGPCGQRQLRTLQLSHIRCCPWHARRRYGSRDAYPKRWHRFYGRQPDAIPCEHTKRPLACVVQRFEPQLTYADWPKHVGLYASLGDQLAKSSTIAMADIYGVVVVPYFESGLKARHCGRR